jgi:allantoinase
VLTLRPRAGAVSDVDLLIRGDERDVAVADGRIVAVGPELGGPAREELDARGLLVLPGVVDAHVHLNEPGRTDWEGFATGTAALAAGGTTCAIDMPLNACRPPSTGRLRRQGRGRDGRGARRRGAVGRLVPGDSATASTSWRARGVVGFKAFMSASGVPEFEAADDLTLLEGMARAGAPGPAGGRARRERGAHAPAGAPRRGRGARRRARLPGLAARCSPSSRPSPRAIAFAAETGCALHVVHVSSGRGVALVAQARARRGRRDVRDVPALPGARREDAERLGAVAKCAPPLRDAAEREGLWAALRAGDVDLVATDHSPVAGGAQGGRGLLRGVGRDRRRPDPAGAALRRGRRGPRPGARGAGRAARAAPARRFGLAPAKGALEVGATPTWLSSTRRRRGRWRARSCSTATG